MNTPVYDFLIQYAERDPVRLHMPGHKGRFGAPALQCATTLDLTEITGADSLFEAEGILAESERNAASLYGTAYTFYSCGGSTLCIQTMLLLMKQQGRAVLAARNVHRAFLNTCVLLDLPVQWIYPRESDGILSGTYDLADFEAALQQQTRPACVYVTSPDYLGRMADIAGLAELCHRYHAKLLVDNAHGAHLAFLPWRCHPIQLGADYCCDSAHKMLSGLTGTAYLHVRSDIDVEPERVRDAMAMFGSGFAGLVQSGTGFALVPKTAGGSARPHSAAEVPVFATLLFRRRRPHAPDYRCGGRRISRAGTGGVSGTA